MKKNKVLLLVNSYDLVKEFESNGNVTFLFPVKGFTVGFINTFSISDIKCDGYIFVNRVLDNRGINDFKKLICNLPSNIKGIVFDDLGVLNVLKDSNLKLTKILFLNHLNCNYLSINKYLEYCDSVIPSTDLTFEETKEILSKTNKPLVVYTFGHMNIMYSRRTLISNYNKHFNSNVKIEATLDEYATHKKFNIIENEYGTVIYTKEPFNGLEYRNYDNVLFNLINSLFLSVEEIKEILLSDHNLEQKYTYKYLSDKETYFKLKERE